MTIDLNLIPFGLSEINGKLLDVADVPRGKNCGCICPSCGTPLVARQGKIIEWHFAHASRSVYTKTKEKCQFSLYVSIRLMARQIIGEQLNITLPCYEGSISQFIPKVKRYISVSFIVTKEQTVCLSNIEVEKQFLGASIDIFGFIKKFSFIIYLTHPGREVPLELMNPSNSKCGIIAISLEEVAQLFKNKKKAIISYQKILSEYLENNITSKKWIFHPRYKVCESKAKIELEKRQSKIIKSYTARKNVTEAKSTLANSEKIKEIEVKTRKKLANFECVMCHAKWQDLEPSLSPCPNCNTHLYRTLKGFVDD